MKSARRDFLRATGMLGMAAFLAACKNGSIARKVIDAGVPESRGMGSNLRTWARYPEKTDLMMLADRPPLLETPVHFFLQDLTPNDAYFVRWHYAGLPTRVDLRTFRTQVIGAVDRPLQLSFDDLRTKFAIAVLLLGLFTGPAYGVAQGAPSTATKPWFSAEERNFASKAKSRTEAQLTLDAEKTYSLAELIDLAEQHNPDTRVAWQTAKTRAAELGVAKSALYPALAAIALAGTNRHGELIGNWTIQTIGVFRPTLNIEYLIFDFGGRSGAIAAARANLFAANFAFNDTHREIIYDVMLTYYRLLDAVGRQDAAKANLANARALEKDAADRLNHGLATKPDVLEANAARTHAEYELANVVGAQEIAQGDLATVLGLPADTVIAVQGMDKLATPTHLAEAANQMIDRAFEQRPDLMERVAHLREVEAELQQAKSVYLPSLSLSSALGKERAYGQQTGFPGSFATAPQFWNVELSLKWTIFDGGKRESEVGAAKARRSRAQADIDAMRDRIEDEVWRAYTNANTAFRQQEAASAQLLASDQSYTAALRAYDLGVRNLLDVLAAQRALADARTADVTARTEVLSQVANLAFTTADLLIPPAANPRP